MHTKKPIRAERALSSMDQITIEALALFMRAEASRVCRTDDRGEFEYRMARLGEAFNAKQHTLGKAEL